MVRRQTRVKKRNRRQQNKTRNNRRQNKSLRRKRQSRRKFRGGLVETREQRAAREARERAAREAREWAARQMRVDLGRREAHDPEHLRMMNDPLPDPRQQWPQQPPQQQQ